MLAVTACSAFSGQDVSVDAGPTDAQIPDANGPEADAADDAAIDGGVDAAPICNAVLSDNFSTQMLSPNWTPNMDPSGNVVVDGMHMINGFALHASVSGAVTGGYAIIYRNVPVNNPSSIQLTYSVYLQSWGSSTGRLGCVPHLTQTASPGASEEVVLALASDGADGVELDGPTSNASAPILPTPTAGWYDATVSISGIPSGTLVVNHSFGPQNGAKTTTNVNAKYALPGPTTDVTVRCGLGGVNGTAPVDVNVWIDNVTLTICQ